MERELDVKFQLDDLHFEAALAVKYSEQGLTQFIKRAGQTFIALRRAAEHEPLWRLTPAKPPGTVDDVYRVLQAMIKAGFGKAPV